MSCGAAFLGFTSASRAQELEPRALTNVPIGTNFLLLGYGYSEGNTLLDPAIPVEGLQSRLHSAVAAYVRAIDFFGMSSKVDLIVPGAIGDWNGALDGQDTSRHITGMGDPRVRLSFNFVGAPAVRSNGFTDYHQSTIVGVSLQVVVPLGQYDPNRLINLGSNRWSVRSQLGVSRSTGPWIIEAYGSVWLFATNQNFLGGLSAKQRPLLASKLHVIRTLSRGLWIGAGVGYAIGGRTEIEGVPRDTRISTFRFAVTGAIPIALNHTVRITFASGARVERGADFDAIVLSYQYRWGGS